MADSFQALCAVLLKDPHSGQLKYISTVIVYAPRTSPLAEVFLPNIFRSAMAHHSLQLGSLPSYDQNDYAYGYYWLPDRQVVDRKKNIRQWREYIEEHFCNDPSFVEDAFLLSSFNEFKTIEQKPDSLVIILTPTRSASSQSRPLSPVAEVHDPIKYRETIAKTARSRKSPSTEAHLSHLRATQTRNVADAIYNGRPLELLGVPVTIYSSAFTKFLRVMADDTLEFTSTELKRIRELIAVSVAYYPNEAERVKYMTEPISSITNYRLLDVTEIPLSSGLIKADGTVRAKVEDFTPIVQPLRCIVEAKSEIGEGGCDPIAQAERCYRAFYSSEEAERLRAACCCPCLLIGMAGPRIMVSGAVFADTLLVQELSDYHSFVPRPTLAKRSPYGQQIYETGRFLRAIETALDDLGAFYESLKLPPPWHHSRPAASLAPPNVYIGPQFTQFEEDGQMVILTYTGRLSDEYPFQAVFTAITHIEGSDTAHDVVVKFTYDYCEEGHRLLAEHMTPEGAPRPLAPRLWHCSNNQDVGMYVVVMDWIMATEERKMTEEDHATVRKAIALLHERNLVFGDLREPNVLLIKGGGLMLIDFDWCGQEGTARYPRDMNENGSIPWAQDAEAGQLIKKQHDLHMLAMLASED